MSILQDTNSLEKGVVINLVTYWEDYHWSGPAREVQPYKACFRQLVLVFARALQLKTCEPRPGAPFVLVAVWEGALGLFLFLGRGTRAGPLNPLPPNCGGDAHEASGGESIRTSPALTTRDVCVWGGYIIWVPPPPSPNVQIGGGTHSLCEIFKLPQLISIVTFVISQMELQSEDAGMGLENQKHTWSWIWKGMWRAMGKAYKCI